MQYRRLGDSRLDISVIGYGCWAMGKTFWGDDVVDEESLEAVRTSLDLGVTFFDTAQAYGYGHSERVLGRALQGVPRAEVIIATKTGLQWDDREESIDRNSSPEYLAGSLEDSLERLQTDYVDLYQIHWPDESVPIADSAAGMKQLLDAGTVRAVGVSNYNVQQMQQFMAVCPLHSLQPPYSMLTRDIEADILPFCRENHIGVLAYSPMARGLLTGKYDETASFPQTDGRANSPMWQGDRLKRNVAAVNQMAGLARQHGKTVAQLALAWVTSQPGLTCALSGTKRPDQIRETAAAGDWQLDDAILAQIDEIIRQNDAG